MFLLNYTLHILHKIFCSQPPVENWTLNYIRWLWVCVLCYYRRSVDQSLLYVRPIFVTLPPAIRPIAVNNNNSNNKAPIWGLRPDFYYCQTVEGILMWGALSDEKMGLPFTIAASPRQRSHSRVRVLWDSWPYFTVSDSRLPSSSPPTTRRATVEVLHPASTWTTHVI
jgi:hypothetical protein